MIIVRGGQFEQLSYTHLKNFTVLQLAMLVPRTYQLSHEVTQLRYGEFVDLIWPGERNDWMKCISSVNLQNCTSHVISLSHSFLSQEFTGSTNWPAFNLVPLWLSWLERCTGIAEVMGSNPCIYDNCLNCPSSTMIISSVNLQNRTSHIISEISL